MQFDPVIVSFTLYTFGIIALGLYSARFSKQTDSDFFLADRGLGAWVSALSSSASAESGWVTLGLVGVAYQTGLGAMWVVLGTFVAFLFNWFVLAWRLRDTAAKQGALTIPDVLSIPYHGLAGQLIRCVGVMIIVSMLVLYVAAQLNAAGTTFNGIFDWKYNNGVLLGFAIVVVYTVTGGFRAVAWTDVVQGGFMILTIVALPILLIVKIGGPVAFWEGLANDPAGAVLTDPYAGKSGLALLGFLTLWLGIPLGNAGQPHVMVRLMAVRDRAAVLRGGVIASVWVLMLFSGAVFLGMAARVYFKGGLDNPEQTLMVIARDTQLVPGFLGGMIVAAVLAAICSTADSQLLVAASSVSHDLIVRIFGLDLSRKARMILDRSAVIGIGLLALSIAIGNQQSVFDFVLDYGWAGLGAGFGPALILTLLWRRTTGWGVLSGMIVGVVTAIVWRWQLPEWHAQVYNLAPAFAFSMLTILVVSLLTKPEEPAADRKPEKSKA
ncbi:sodium/proline symporter [Lignipirellula cremea]|uniref:Sodium/proline symporter n=1 Tax=Lignipirellula cremea TaxID=2528010 RepID=A0A518DVW8_9BACT|nr:sodium/proline symporter [Lignipirellula cremea]QDU95978.1 Sodium/proline symporter [Lignipirellula cremea]